MQRLINANAININDTIGGLNDFADCIRESVQTVLDNAPTVLTIPENPTNGDMIVQMYDVKEVHLMLVTVFVVLKDGIELEFNRKWFEAPYKNQ